MCLGLYHGECNVMFGVLFGGFEYCCWALYNVWGFVYCLDVVYIVFVCLVCGLYHGECHVAVV